MVRIRESFRSACRNYKNNLLKLRVKTWSLAVFAVAAIVLVYVSIDVHKSRNVSSEVPLNRVKRHHVLTVQEILRFPENYHAKGVLSLPHGDIKEPFEIWFAGSHKMSRIDYYGGMDRTYQRQDLGQFGFACKIVPEFSEKTQSTFQGCLHRRGTPVYPIKVQSIIPSPRYFKYGGDKRFRGFVAAKWIHSFTIYNKINTYTLYTTKYNPPTPLRYEMMGYDTLLSSYYDHYIIDYNVFEPWKFDYNIFKIPLDLDCFDFTHKKYETTVGDVNPMLEFMPHSFAGAPYTLSHPSPSYNEYGGDNYDTSQYQNPMWDQTYAPEPSDFNEGLNVASWIDLMRHQFNPGPFNEQNDPKLPGTGVSIPASTTTHPQAVNTGTSGTSKKYYEQIVNILFDIFKKEYKKNYTTRKEQEKRKNIYRHNLRFIQSRNRQHLGYKLKANHLADMTDEEIQMSKGLLQDPDNVYNGGKVFKTNWKPGQRIPKELDWRIFGAVNKVKSQGICGSCYAYAVIGAIESAHFMKTGFLPDLSEQQVIDCTWGFGNRGCRGGYPYRAMQWIIKHGGIATDKSYGRYLAQEGFCHFKNTTIGATIDGYMNITRGNITELKLAVLTHGPVTVLINTQPKSFKFYSSGTYFDSKCSHSLDHAALLVGFGEEKGHKYWIIKNSWSESWGDKGYIKISMRKDNCGVAQKAVVVSMTGGKKHSHKPNG